MFDGIAEHEDRKTELAIFYKIAYFFIFYFLLFLFNLFYLTI